MLKFLTSGAVVNFFTVIIGTLIGLAFKKGIPERVRKSLMNGMALCVLYIGISGLFEGGTSILIIIVSFALGAVVGELADFDSMINKLGAKLEGASISGNTKISEGFVTASLLFCVGAMTVVGSIESGLTGDNSTLYSKAVIDCITSAVLASSIGVGVIFAALSVLTIEGTITLLAAVISPILTDTAIANMSLIGSLLIIALSFNMLGLTKIKVMNYLPAIFLPLILCMIM